MQVPTFVTVVRNVARLGGSSSTPLLLDLVPNAFASYDLRKVRNAYAGSCIRIRRDSDNTEQDIGFGTDGWLDTAAIATFCGAGSGYVCKWYDQSSNARDLAQTTTTIQPIIYESGVQCVLNSKPCLKFVAATGHRMTNGTAGDWNFLHDGTVKAFVSMVSQCNDTAAVKVIFSSHAGASNNTLGLRVTRTATETMQSLAGNGSASVINCLFTTTSTSQRINSLSIDPANGTAANRLLGWGNGSASPGSNAQTGTPSTSNSSVLSVGANNGGGSPFDGTMQALHFWASDKTSDRTTLESNLNTAYSVY